MPPSISCLRSTTQVTAILGFNQEYNRSDNFTAERYDIISNSLPSIGLSSGVQYVDQTYKDWAIRGLFFRANYSYDNRYIFEMNGRYDGTSRFPKNKRFGFFPSGSVAWRVDSESFFKESRLTDIFSQFKLRASYGSLGNQLVSEYGYIPYMSSQLGQLPGGRRVAADRHRPWPRVARLYVGEGADRQRRYRPGASSATS